MMLGAEESLTPSHTTILTMTTSLRSLNVAADKVIGVAEAT
jgi:hypothetical protein